MRALSTLPGLSFALALAATGCRASSHPLELSPLGKAVASTTMVNVLAKPGPIEFETVVSADWEIFRSGLINLDHEKSKAAGLEDGAEPIQIYFHVLHHPKHGSFIVDTGVETLQRIYPKKALLRGLVGKVMNVDKMTVHQGLGEWLRGNRVRLSGVFLTHLHVDHVSGMRDVPKGTPIYLGPGEVHDRLFQNVFVAPIINRALEGQHALLEWQFQADAEGRFAGVLDVFGDQSVFAIHVPGHTPGSTAYLVRSTRGPVLLLGDACHTRWGWENGVEPGSFSSDQATSRVSLDRLRALVESHPSIVVRLGHQSVRPEPIPDAQ